MAILNGRQRLWGNWPRSMALAVAAGTVISATWVGPVGQAVAASGPAVPDVSVSGTGPGGVGVPERTSACGASDLTVVVSATFSAPATSFQVAATARPTGAPPGGSAPANSTRFRTALATYKGPAVRRWAFDVPVTAVGALRAGAYTLSARWSMDGSAHAASAFTQVEPQVTSNLSASSQCALARAVSSAATVANGLEDLSPLAKARPGCAGCAALSAPETELSALFGAGASLSRSVLYLTPDFDYQQAVVVGKGAAPALHGVAPGAAPLARAVKSLDAELSQQYQLQKAMVAAMAREWAAGLAGSSYWSALQARSVVHYADELSTDLAKETPSLASVVKALPLGSTSQVVTTAVAQRYQQQAAQGTLWPGETAVVRNLVAAGDQVQVAATQASVSLGQVEGKSLPHLLGPVAAAAVHYAQQFVQAVARSQSSTGYWVVGATGSVRAYGSARPLGARASASPTVAVAASPGGQGYWLAERNGAVRAFGAVPFYGPAPGRRLSGPVTAMAASADGHGYWLATSNGQVNGFGDAKVYPAAKKTTLSAPVVAMAGTSDGRGYWLATSSGQVLSFGDAGALGPQGSAHLAAPVVALASTDKGQGLWMATSAGQVLHYGDAVFYGPTGRGHFPGRVVALTASPDGQGYWLLNSSGQVARYGDAQLSPPAAGAARLSGPAVGLAATSEAGPGTFGAGVFNFLLPGVVPDAGHAVGDVLEADGRTWVTEPASSAIASIAPDGSVRQYVTPTPDSHPLDLAAGEGGDIWFTEQAVNKIGLILPSGKIDEFPVPVSGTQLSGIALGPDGRAWFVELQSGEIGAITTAGVISQYYLHMSGSGPRDIARGPDGRMWFVQDSSDSVGAISMTGQVSEYPVPTGASHPRHIIAGPDGRMWLTEFSGNKVGAVTMAGKITEYPLTTANASPDGVTKGPDGQVWFTEAGAGKIGAVNPATGKVSEYPLLGNASEPLAIASGANGTLLVSDNFNMSVDVMYISQLKGLAS